MATATAVSIGTSNKVSVDYQSQEVSINVTYELERSDTDLLAFVVEKTAEVEQAHSSVWRRIREIRADTKAQEAADKRTPGNGKAPTTSAQAPVESPEPPPPTVRRGRNGKGASPTPVRVEARTDGAPTNGNGHTVTAEAESDPFGDEPDETNTPASVPEVAPAQPSEEMSSVAQQRAILSIAARARMADQTFLALLSERFAKRAVEQLTRREAAQLLVELQRRDRVPAASAAWHASRKETHDE